MEAPDAIFSSWVPRKWIVPILLLCLLPQFMVLLFFNMNSTFTASVLDLDVDDLQFLFSMGYAMFICALFTHIRMFHFFNTKSYLLLMTMANILLLFGMSLTTNTTLLLILRFIQGAFSAYEGFILLPILIANIPNEHARVVTYSFLYGFILIGDKLTSSLVKFAVEHYDFNMIIYTVMLIHTVVLAIYVLIFNGKRMFRKKPLYQLNLGGVFLMSIALISGAFFFVYGKRYWWFESYYIQIAFVLMLTFSGLFILHQRTSKRPIFHFEILQSRRVLISWVLFVCFYIFRATMSNVYQLMGQVWKWHWEYVLEMQYYNVAGSIMGSLIGYYMIRFKADFKYIFLFGFAMMGLAMYYFSWIFVPDPQPLLVGVGLILEGIGQGALFTPIVLFMFYSVPVNASASALQSGTALRFWSSLIGYALMQNSLLRLTTKHQQLMTFNLDLTHTVYQKQWEELYTQFSANYLHNDAVSLSVQAIKNQVYNQALLVSNMEIFRTLFVFAVVICIVILMYSPFQKWKIKRQKMSMKQWLEEFFED